MRPEELAEIRARVEAATPGPWWVEDGGPDSGWRIECDRGTVADLRVYTGNGDDALLLTRARADIPALLAEVERLRGIVSSLTPADADALEWATAPGEAHRLRLIARELTWGEIAAARAALAGESNG